jgi:hypothetical protein
VSSRSEEDKITFEARIFGSQTRARREIDKIIKNLHPSGTETRKIRRKKYIPQYVPKQAPSDLLCESSKYLLYQISKGRRRKESYAHILPIVVQLTKLISRTRSVK